MDMALSSSSSCTPASGGFRLPCREPGSGVSGRGDWVRSSSISRCILGMNATQEVAYSLSGASVRMRESRKMVVRECGGRDGGCGVQTGSGKRDRVQRTNVGFPEMACIQGTWPSLSSQPRALLQVHALNDYIGLCSSWPLGQNRYLLSLYSRSRRRRRRLLQRCACG